MPTPKIYMKLEQHIYGASRGRMFIGLLFFAIALVVLASAERALHVPIAIVLLLVPFAATFLLFYLLKGYSSSRTYLGRKNTPSLRLWVAVAFDTLFVFIALSLLLAVANLLWPFIEYLPNGS